MTGAESQLTDTVLMIRPVRFEQNPLTLVSNKFMAELDVTPDAQQKAAATEFESLRAALIDAGINVIVVDDTDEPHTPDSVFPNNWVTFHSDGRVVLYPMEAPNRRTERRSDIVDRLHEEYDYDISEVIDLSPHEEQGRYLEGTGSLVLDRTHRVAYACRSSRTHVDVLAEFGERLGYDVVQFAAVDRHGIAIYHTNVFMNVGEAIAVICAEAIADTAERELVLERLRSTGHEILTLDFDQLDAFAGNMLELRNSAGEHVFAMSQSAFDSLRPDQRDRLLANGRVAVADIRRIEQSAGGSVRCMLAEVHLPKRPA
ncbi:MAG: arginine deiminase-related protein [Woeseiaceae bacterium]|nr:arginine deiminase-related protein [Woeseiaceae bacterium]